jgi:hypothetical protein
MVAMDTSQSYLRNNRRVHRIGATGFEPAAFWSQTRRSAKLSYAPDFLVIIVLESNSNITAEIMKNNCPLTPVRVASGAVD